MNLTDPRVWNLARENLMRPREGPERRPGVPSVAELFAMAEQAPEEKNNNAENGSAENRNNNNVININLETNIACAKKKHEEISKLNGTFATDENIYMYFGHGSDLMTKEGNLIIKKVPENCIYITQTICGIVNYGGPNIIKFIKKENEHIWRNPVKYKNELEALMLNVPNIHIHYPGCSYVDMSFLPFGVGPSDREANHTIGFSGLVSLAKAKTINPKDEIFTKNDEYGPVNYYGKSNIIPVNKLQYYFGYSVYPKIQLGSAPLVRKDNFTFYLKENDVSRSVNLNQIFDESERLSSLMPVSKLMEHFPGIHFNFTCRVAWDDPRGNILKRRRHSAVVQNNIYGSIYRGAIQGFPETGNKDRSLLSFLKSIEDFLRKDKNYQVLYDIVGILNNRVYLYEESFSFMASLFKELYLEKFKELLRESDTNEIKKFIDILQYDIKENDRGNNYSVDEFSVDKELLEIILRMAFEANKRSVVRYLCAKGAPKDELFDSYELVKQKANRKTRVKKMFIIKDCLGAQRGGKERRKTRKNKRA